MLIHKLTVICTIKDLPSNVRSGPLIGCSGNSIESSLNTCTFILRKDTLIFQGSIVQGSSLFMLTPTTTFCKNFTAYKMKINMFKKHNSLLFYIYMDANT